jgi:pSer/pThr/pTyr-binding forkhead associated (FHA) protein
LGRDGEMATAVLADRSVARLHARVKWGDGRYWLTDEGSDTGTLLNHERLGLSPRLLADGDEIRLGRVRLQFTLHETEEEARAIAAEETTPMPPEEAEAAAENETETKETEEVDGDHDSDL